MNVTQKRAEERKREHTMQQENRLAEQEQIIREQQTRNETLESQNRYLSESFDTLSNAFFWKITKPVQVVLGYTKLFFRKVRSKLFQTPYHIDVINIVGNSLHISGWIFDRKHEIEKLELMLLWNRTAETRDITKRRLKRPDVEAAFQTKMGLHSGFDQFFHVKLPPTDRISVCLLFTVKGQRKKIRVGKINIAKSKSTALLEQSGCVRGQFLDSELSYTPLTESVDIIVPVYNGYQFLEKLFDGLRETDNKHRVFFIDDNSPDKRVLPALQRFASERENVTVMHNEQNLGFVKTVNSALKISTKHVVILNTDVELPRAWIERLVKPIFQFENVASVTPFSNCATIFSFPEFGDNPLYRNLSVDELDRYFRFINPQYTLVPTGVGFCMAMNRKALDSIGLLDDELFEKGYGEENDWCQRAIKAGFVNVHAENLFIYHKHGGSFLPEEKKRLIEEHSARLTARHPNYLADVTDYTQKNPLKNLRAHLRFRIRCANTGKNTTLVFTHNLGGGADMYLDLQCPKWQTEGNNILILRYVSETDSYRMDCMFSEEAFELELEDWEDLVCLLQDCTIDQIVVNELVTYPNLLAWLSDIQHLKQEKSARLTMLVHDYLAVSPSINLISPQDWVYAREGNCFHCDRFYNQDGWVEQYDCPSIKVWRQRWEQFLLGCDEVRCFSESSRQIMSDVYPTLRNFTVVPHIVDYMPRVQKARKTTATLNIGVLGILAQHKGRTIVCSLCEQIEREQRDIKIVLIGEEDGSVIPTGKHFEKTGRYEVEDIPWLVLEKDVDLFLLPSIWPETFSYTAEEIMQMGLPIICLDVGAPAERIRSYEKGLVLSGKEPQTILKEICDFARSQDILPPENANIKRFLFVAEYISYSSRYRVDHAREQLFTAGIDSDFIEACDLKKGVNLQKYQGIYLYRCRNLSPLKEFLLAAKGKVPIIYDIDDYIFAYDKIQTLAFLKQQEYKDFDVYSQNILSCMKQCDAFVTSTESLAGAIREQFPNRRVFVNRNHASAAMYILSQKAILTDPGHEGTLLGYFSGSKTHDEDFSMIEGALISLMRKYPKLRLMVVGCCRLSSAFDEFPDRVIQKEFVSWRELPALIRFVDINLMPLTDSFFNYCKSENKWTEAALVKRVTVGVGNPELLTAVNAEEIVFFDTEQNFENEVSKLIDSKETREAIAEKAFQTACEKKLTIRDYNSFAAYMRSFCP